MHQSHQNKLFAVLKKMWGVLCAVSYWITANLFEFPKTILPKAKLLVNRSHCKLDYLKVLGGFIGSWMANIQGKSQ